MATIDDPLVRSVLRDLAGRLRRRFGRNYVGLILFGSRARGDNRPDSDADVAIILSMSMEKRWSLKCRIIEDTYPILLETGLYIQPWPIEERELDNPERSSNPALVRNILREGIPALRTSSRRTPGEPATGLTVDKHRRPQPR
ncbi:MAG TPA: nucleotidyltransferase domain-containing protein [Stellaceae bacterium]|nr:nucleotidyltransferase domain-containing protein [Stellaceae bacterium]